MLLLRFFNDASNIIELKQGIWKDYLCSAQYMLSILHEFICATLLTSKRQMPLYPHLKTKKQKNRDLPESAHLSDFKVSSPSNFQNQCPGG